MLNLKELSSLYENTHEKNLMVYDYCENIAKADDIIWNHRLYIKNFKLGWGDDAFHGMWKLIIDELDNNFKFLEIGIYKGQILTLIALLAKIQDKRCLIFGISPLDNIGDVYWQPNDSDDYERDIRNLINKFELDNSTSTITLYKGFSNFKDSVEFAEVNKEYDIIYIDGSHNYDIVVSDINNYKEMIKLGGYLVMDDASNYLNLPPNINSGLPNVSNATRDYLENDTRFINILNCGHNRIFKRVTK